MMAVATAASIENIVSNIIRGKVPSATIDFGNEHFLAVMKNRKRLLELLKTPVVAQRTAEWYALRLNRLTASDLAQALNKGKFGNRKKLLERKAFPDEDPLVDFPVKGGGVGPLTWGTMFEPCALRCYIEKKGGVTVHEFGLIPHPTIPEFGASPDGISDVGVMVELKCPWKRVIIKGEIPEQYYLQIQGQLEVCGLDYCDYLECDIQRYENHNEYEADIEATKTVNHGAVLQLNPSGYLYSPDDMNAPHDVSEWVEKHLQEHDVKGIHYWRERDYNLVRVKRDADLFNSLVPDIKAFWKDVVALREQGASNTAKRVKKEKSPSASPATPALLKFRDDDD